MQEAPESQTGTLIVGRVGLARVCTSAHLHVCTSGESILKLGVLHAVETNLVPLAMVPNP